MLTQRTARTVLIALIGLVAFAPSARADHQWGQRHWADPTPIRVVDYGATRATNPQRWSRTVRAALSEWEQAGVVTFRYRRARGQACEGFDRRSIAQIRRGFPDGQISVCRMQGGNPMVAGWTSAPPGPGGAIREAVVALRSPNTACHEFGHALGLDHPRGNAEDDSCVGIGDWRFPGVHDLQQLQALYG